MDKVHSLVDTVQNDENKMPYMSVEKIEGFKKKLLEWRNSILSEESKLTENINEALDKMPDHVDMAAAESMLENEFIPKINREQELLFEIDKALERIKKGTFGYCEKSGEPIDIKRLEIWPIARLSLEKQKEMEEGY